MSAFDTEDLKTEIDTIFEDPEKSMEGVNESSTQNSPTKSILKSPSTSFKEKDFKKEFLDQSQSSYASHSGFIARPQNVSGFHIKLWLEFHSIVLNFQLDDFVKKEGVTDNCDLESTFTLDDLSEDEEIWVIDIPGTVCTSH